MIFLPVQAQASRDLACIHYIFRDPCLCYLNSLSEPLGWWETTWTGVWRPLWASQVLRQVREPSQDQQNHDVPNTQTHHWLLAWATSAEPRLNWWLAESWANQIAAFLFLNSGWRSLVGCSPWGRKESDTTERLHFHFSLSCIGEGNGNSLQCSCLENPRVGGAWWAAVSGVTQSRTRLKRLSSSRFGGLLAVSNWYAPFHTKTSWYLHLNSYQLPYFAAELPGFNILIFEPRRVACLWLLWISTTGQKTEPA